MSLSRRHRLATRLANPTESGDEPGYEWRDETRRTLYVGHESFDRLGFARRVLDALNPPRLAVLLRHGRHEIRVESGERWHRPGHTWACVAIPSDASREEIVFALLECVGAKNDPYWSETLLAIDAGD